MRSIQRAPRRSGPAARRWWAKASDRPSRTVQRNQGNRDMPERNLPERDLPERNWFITGASSGFGRILTERLLARGDNRGDRTRPFDPERSQGQAYRPAMAAPGP